jgi:hypothetical protein
VRELVKDILLSFIWGFSWLVQSVEREIWPLLALLSNDFLSSRADRTYALATLLLLF